MAVAQRSVSQEALAVADAIKRSVVEAPWLIPILNRLRIYVADGVGTAYVDHERGVIAFDRGLVRSLCGRANPQMCRQAIYYILLHEVMHAVLEHGRRFPPGADPLLRNIAGDVVINEALDRSGIFPPGVRSYIDNVFGGRSMDAKVVADLVYKHIFGRTPNEDRDRYERLVEAIRGMDAASIYLLLERLERAGAGQEIRDAARGTLAGGEAESRPGSGREEIWSGEGAGEPLRPEDVGQALADAIKSTAMHSMGGRSAGEGAGGLEAVLRVIYPRPRVNWARYLDNVLLELYGEDVIQTWRKPNRRMGEEMPGTEWVSETAGRIAILVDVSGSIDDETLKKFIDEAIYIAKKYGAETYIITWDDGVRAVYKIPREGAYKPITIKTGGGGGTDPTEALKYAAKLKPDVIILFTDGLFGSIDREVAEEAKKTAKKAIYVYTIDENKDIFEGWARIHYTP